MQIYFSPYILIISPFLYSLVLQYMVCIIYHPISSIQLANRLPIIANTYTLLSYVILGLIYYHTSIANTAIIKLVLIKPNNHVAIYSILYLVILHLISSIIPIGSSISTISPFFISGLGRSSSRPYWPSDH